MSAAPIAEAIHVSKRFARVPDFAEKIASRLGAPLNTEVVHAVDGVDLAIQPGEVLGLVGESGSGKSTLGRMLAGMLSVSDGEVRWQGQDRRALTGTEAHRARLAAQIIFQDPMSALNPRKRVRDLIAETPLAHGLIRRAEADDFVSRLLQRVGLDARYADRYPHQFSGGQRQRICIARALAVNPNFVVCDESVAALDVSIRAQILNLFMELKAELGLTYLFISHDLSVVRHISDRVAILYLGRIVETASAQSFFAEPNHPYTIALLAEMPDVSMRRKTYVTIKGEIPSPVHPPSGCHFHPRCPKAFARCSVERPALREIAAGHWSACHLNDERRPSSDPC